MNRNIMTEADRRKSIEKNQKLMVAFAETSPGARAVPSVDTYFDRLSKYVPMEIIGAYLIIEGILKQLLQNSKWLPLSLLVLLILSIVSSWFYAEKVLRVIRKSQLSMTAIAVFVWVFATGGCFAAYIKNWPSGLGTIAVVIFAVMVRIVKIGPLPPVPES